MKVVFMGTPQFAVPALKEIALKGHTLAAVITQPDRASGRGRKINASPVKSAALELGLPVMQPRRIKDMSFIDNLKELAPDIIVVAAFGQILPKSVLELPRYGCVNIHASLLPGYRGAAPIHRAVINGERETGITIMYMDEGLDTGDMLMQQPIPIECGDTVGSVHDRLSVLGAEMIASYLDNPRAKGLLRIKQDHNLASYAPMLTREDEKINWGRTAREIFNHVRGMDPWPGAHTLWNGRVLKIWRSEMPGPGNDMAASYNKRKGKPGQVLEINEKGMLVETTDVPLLITEVQLQGGKRMQATEFSRGHVLTGGLILG